ncbi:MAG: putative porin, partial [Verrucomicrobiota bacterium]
MNKQKLIGAMIALGSIALLTTTYAEISISGDLRVRGEHIDQDARDERDRLRIRGRIKMDADLNDNAQVGLRLATGSGDPVSRNQSLDGSFSLKNFGLDQAFIDWTPGGGSLTFTGGKMVNPMVIVKDLVWDGDVTPEGI